MARKKYFRDEEPIEQRPLGTTPVRPPLQVSELIEVLNTMLSAEPVVVEGEVSGLNVSQGKWVFFDLKDATSKVSCFMMTYQLYRMAFQPVDGSKVIVTGVPKLFSKSGKFVLTVESIEAAGEGELARAFSLLKQKLEGEGLFAQERKRLLPRFVERMILITSAESAAYTDFLRILKNRWGGVDIVLIPVAVQGKDAIADITSAFQMVPQLVRGEQSQVVVLTRGGGGLEDLHAFNSEEVVRAIYDCPIPVISAIGHERDITIADLVADVRAATPSNAAEVLVPDKESLGRQIDAMLHVGASRLDHRIQEGKHLIARSLDTMGNTIRRKTESVDTASDHLERALDLLLLEMHRRIDSMESVLAASDPKRILARGYSIVRNATGDVVKRAEDVATGEVITVEPHQGKVRAKVVAEKE